MSKTIDEYGYIDLMYYYNNHTSHTFKAMWDQVAKNTKKEK